MSPILGSRGFGRWIVSSLGGVGPWWYAIYTDTTAPSQFWNLDLVGDNAGSAYYVYSTTGGGVQEPKIFKISNSGAVTWARRIHGSAWSQDHPKVQWEQGELLVSGVNGTGSAQQNFAMRLNADGTTNGAVNRTVTVGGLSAANYHLSAAMDASNNIYVAGMYYTGSDYNNFITRFTSAGAISWTLFFTSYDPRSAIKWGGSNLYYTKYSTLYKINASGTLVNSRVIGTTPNTSQLGQKAGIDSSENNYRSGSNGTNGFLFRFDSDLLMTWGKSFTWTQNPNQYGSGAVLDSAGNMYTYYHFPGANKSMLVVKSNSSGTILWSRSFAFRISGAYPYVGGVVMATYSNTDIILTVQQDTTTNRPQIVVKLPADGTKTGTYTNGAYSFDWTAETPTFSTLTATYTTPSAPSTITGTIGTGIPSNSAWASYTVTKTDIPA